MIPAKVIGRLVASHALDAFRGVKFLVVQPMDEHCEPKGAPLIACDAIGANVGERVVLVQGGEATFPLPEAFNCSDMTIVSIIDEVTP